MKKQTTIKDFRKGVPKQFGCAHDFAFITPHAARLVKEKVDKENNNLKSIDAAVSCSLNNLQDNIESLYATLTQALNPCFVLTLPHSRSNGGANYTPFHDAYEEDSLVKRLHAGTGVASFFRLHIVLNGGHSEAYKEYNTLFDFSGCTKSDRKTRSDKLSRLCMLGKTNLLADTKIDRINYPFIVREKATDTRHSREITGYVEIYAADRQSVFSVTLPVENEIGRVRECDKIEHFLDYEPGLDAALRVAERNVKKLGLISTDKKLAGVNNFHRLSEVYIKPIAEILSSIFQAFTRFKELEKRFDAAINSAPRSEIANMYMEVSALRPVDQKIQIGESCFGGLHKFLSSRRWPVFLGGQTTSPESVRKSVGVDLNSPQQLFSMGDAVRISIVHEKKTIVFELKDILIVSVTHLDDEEEPLVNTFYLRHPTNQTSHVYTELILRYITESLNGYLQKRLEFEAGYLAVVEKPRGITDEDFAQSA